MHTCLTGVIQRSATKWEARIGFENKDRYIGTYDSAIEAALAYDEAARGKFNNGRPRWNFKGTGDDHDPNSSVSVGVPASPSTGALTEVSASIVGIGHEHVATVTPTAVHVTAVEQEQGII